MGTTDATIRVDPQTAADLRDPPKREAVGRLVSRVLQREHEQNIELLFGAIERFGTDAAAKGLTDEILEQEFAAYNAERAS